MIDVNAVKAEAEREVREELSKKAKEEIKGIIRRLNSAKQVVANLDRELADAYAELGRGTSEPTS